MTDSPNDQFGKVMRIPDEALSRYARLGRRLVGGRGDQLARAMADGTRTPDGREKAYRRSGRDVYHGADAARAAREHFERTIQRGELPADIPERRLDGLRKLVDVTVAAGIAESKRAASA